MDVVAVVNSDTAWLRKICARDCIMKVNKWVTRERKQDYRHVGWKGVR